MARIDPSTRQVVITGVGYREATSEQRAGNVFASNAFKPNIGAVVALAAARAGYAVSIVSKTQSKLDKICSSIGELVPSSIVSSHAIDLLSPLFVDQLAEGIPNNREVDIIHCAGLSAGNYLLPDDNPYLPLDQTPFDLPVLEFEAVVKSLLIVIRAFLARLKSQQQARLVVVSSMSGIRAVPWGFSHSSAKGGLRQAVRSLALELNPHGIHVSEVQPGIVDTGLYDSMSVKRAVAHIASHFGYKYDPDRFPKMDAEAVAEAVMLCLSSDAHILAISMVSRGQFPNLGA